MKILISYFLLFALSATNVFAMKLNNKIKDSRLSSKCCKKVINKDQNQCDYRKVQGACTEPYFEIPMNICDSVGTGEKPCESTMSGGTLNLNP